MQIHCEKKKPQKVKFIHSYSNCTERQQPESKLCMKENYLDFTNKSNPLTSLKQLEQNMQNFIPNAHKKGQ